ncbi:hypothetical protein NEMIN01_2503, partial [Nematocida minor]|uniref:uncharacterized protein n=1 Tax=Nematocida minor TaxID=1912983 RepID=UPI0022201FA7
TYITICNSAPSSNFKFTEFDCFTRVREVTLIDVSLHSNTFKDMEKITKMSEITFKGKTKLVGDTSVKVDIDSLESLVISGLDVAEIKHFLSALDIESREYSSFRLSIEKISLVDTQIISSLSYLPSLACLSLNDIVFKGVPDFTFIKRIKSLHTLRMLNIFYGYNEKYEESSFENIRKNVNYLNISQVQNESKYSEYTEEEKSIIAENKKIGSEISLSYFSSNNNIYSDLGISKVKLREFTSIHVAFPLLKGRTVYDALIYDMNFSLNLKEKSLTIMANMPFEENEILTGITNSLDCPFSSCDEIKNIKISITNKSYLSDKFVHTLISLLFLYPDSNPIETITILSKETASVHIEKLIECGKRFKTLKRIEFINSRPYKNGSPIVKDDTIEEVKDTLDYKIDMIAKVEKESYSYRTIITFSREA